MKAEEIKALGEKVAAGSATPEEKLVFLRELNVLIKGMRADLTQAKSGK